MNQLGPQTRFVAAEPECRAEDGVHFADGRVIVLEIVEGDAVRTHETTTLASLNDEAPDDWIGLEPSVRVLSGRLVASGGGTTWEGEGWVALQTASDDALVWIVKLAGGEAVTEIRFAGDALIARSEAYPFVVEWHIPVKNPEAVTISRRRWDDLPS